MERTEAETLYRQIADRVVEVYEEGVVEHPGLNLMVLHVPGQDGFPTVLPFSDFKETLQGRMDDLLERVNEPIERGAFWFALVDGDDEQTHIFVRVVHPAKHRADRALAN